MRVKGWERALTATISRHAALPFSWDKSNCLYMPMDVVLAVTGLDPWADERGCKSETEFGRRLVKYGFKTIADAYAAKFPEIPVAFMGRADLGVIEHAGGVSGVVCLGPDVAGKPGAHVGMIYLPRNRVVRAFKVD